MTVLEKKSRRKPGEGVDRWLPERPRALDIRGQRFGSLVAVEFAGVVPCGKSETTTWWCECDCGARVRIRLGNLRGGLSTACAGCGHKKAGNSVRTHGQSRAVLYWLWRKVRKEGCCERWSSAERFLEDLPPRPSKAFVFARRDAAQPHSPENSLWRPRKEVFKRPERLFACRGERLTAAQWARKLGVSRQRIFQRLANMPQEVALSYPHGGTSPEYEAWLEERNAELAAARERRRAEKGVPQRLSREKRRERRREMARAVRDGEPLASVAARYGVCAGTVRIAVEEARREGVL